MVNGVSAVDVATILDGRWSADRDAERLNPYERADEGAAR
jgi:hypothetical protein